MRVAIVHHWFVTRGGGERVAECIASLFPQAEIFTLVATPAGLPASLATGGGAANGRRLHTSFLQQIPFGASHHRHLMPLYPAAVESLDLRGFDLILSSDAGPVKGVRIDPGAVHICYCHSPMRYLHDGYEQYRRQMHPLVRAAFTAAAGRVRRSDVAAAQRVTHFIANSRYVAARIERIYGRAATVIHPPIDLHLARTAQPGDHYLCAGRLVGYKRTDLWIEACLRSGRSLRIAGAGPQEAALRRAAGPNVRFLGELSTEALWQQYAECRALLFAADEDFGMVPLEAQACGRPVVCYGVGGSLETVRGAGEQPTGVYFREQTVDSALRALDEFEVREAEFSAHAIQEWAAGFATPIFLRNMRQFLIERVPGIAAEMAPESFGAQDEKRSP
jgi:glycosyltransferase involved in cell wall biosynthesis